MDKINLDWSNMGFGYRETPKRYVANFKNGEWEEGFLTEDANVVISEAAGVLHYAQTCFEGLKAYRNVEGQIVIFRPNLNAQRMSDTAKRLVMPPFPEERFIEAIREVVKANEDYIPPYGSGATLYIRPYMFATGPVIGVKPADAYQFRIFTTPVGPYFSGGAKSIALCVSDFDRAAPNGTGDVKAGLNYAMSLYPLQVAKENGFSDNMYLDAKTHTQIEETGGANFIFVTEDDKLVTPKSPSILPSITRRSLMEVAKNYLGIEVEERIVYLDELKTFKECALCGTAAVISPVGSVSNGDEKIVFSGTKDGMGPVTQKLYDTLLGIQQGEIEGPEGWVCVIE